MSLRIKFEPRDLWVGVFWRYYSWPDEWCMGDLLNEAGWELEVFVCLIPCLPIILKVTR